MSRLNNALIESLLSCTTAEKEEIGNRIVEYLGGDYTKVVHGLPARRGNGDGGIDGRIPVYQEQFIRVMRPERIDLYDEEVRKVIVNAGFCIKLEKSTFDRYELAAFKSDMEREKLFEGIIISARDLSPDAEVELDRVNSEKKFKIIHIKLGSLLNGEYECDLLFVQDIKEAFKSGIRNAIK